MTYKIDQLGYDLVQKRVTIALNKHVDTKNFHINVNIPLASGQATTEHDLEEKAKLAVKAALEEALRAL